ncbi:MAG: pyridoxamine 5'-phosphate oxidase [Acidobacteria bacterium]|nr:MAG: pyridoxamine 5'-phosphate oxidase [Acidobacteriota bacterium]
MTIADPIAEYIRAAARAEQRGVDTAPAALGTADLGGRPAVRIVLIRHVDDRGFVFHTNYNSRKGTELSGNPYAALCIHWPALEEQIRIEGRVERVPPEESDAYFDARPRGSQIGAWASEQSADLPSRAALEARTREIEERFDGRAVPRPPYWGGLRVVPDRMEFWYGRPDRLHDRVLYLKSGGFWTTSRLYP